MRLFKYLIPVFFAALFALLLSPLQLMAEAAGEYIAISKVGSGKIALVLDRSDSQGKKEEGWARKLDAAMHDGLDFTGIFTLISPPLNVREKSDVINFGSLTSVGSEVYAGGTVTNSAGNINLTMAVYETAGAKLLLKRSYAGTESGIRAIAHAFCADLVELLTGKRSVFGSKIVFISNKTGFKEIYECDFDGQGLQQLTNSRSITLTPALSPDGKHLAYTDYTTGRPTLHIKNLADGTIASTAKTGISIDPAWRSNSEVATTLSFEGDQALYLIRLDGSVSRRVTNSKGIDVSPTFSPDGSKMAFVSSRNGLPQIFIQDLQSGQTKRLTFSGRYNTQPSWSPAGDKIAYSTWENGGEINIFVINADGSGLTQLTGKCGENDYPSWSPDGEMIIFASNREGVKKLYVMSSAGENQRRLLQLSGEETQPFWSLFR